jgi:hypothetical protein
MLSMLATKYPRSRRIPALCEPLEERALMSTYYVSPAGNDSHAGTSVSTAWKSITKVNSVSLKPGDTVLFQGGQTFDGSMYFSSGKGGSATSPVTIGSYGGIATIYSGTSDGARVFNTGGFLFENLKFQGTPGAATQYGIDFESNTTSGKMPYAGVNDCEVTGYTGSGIMVMGDYSTAGFSNVRITNNSVHDNVDCGIETLAHAERTIDDVYIAYNEVFSNYGDGVSAVTGSGIEVGDVETAMVEHNISYDNGWKGGNGGVGIWAYESDDVVFQYNESGDNHGLRGEDGDGFDFDADTSNSLMQFNFSVNNDGTGFQLDQWRNDALFQGDVVRYNVAVNNGQRNGYGNLEVWGKVENSSLYGNTIYVSPPKDGSSTSGIRVYNKTISGLYAIGVHISDNTIYSSGGVPFINVPSGESAGSEDLVFSNDTFDSGGATPTFIYNSVTYHTLASYAEATGEEETKGVLNSAMSYAPLPAYSIDPRLNETDSGSGAKAPAASPSAQATSASVLFGQAAVTNLATLISQALSA